jgi:hypothetical protein
MKAIRIFVVCCAVVLCATSSFAATWTATQIGDVSNLAAAGGTVLSVYNNNLYAAAAVNNATWGNVANAQFYDGSSWKDTGLAASAEAAKDFQAWNGKLYMSVGGSVFSSTGGEYAGWTLETEDVAYKSIQMTEYNGNLILASADWGKMWTWDGTTMTQIGRLPAGADDEIGDAMVYNGKIYVANANWGNLHWGDDTLGGDGDLWAKSSAGVTRTNLLDSIVEWNGGLWAAANTDNLASTRVYQLNEGTNALVEEWSMRLPAGTTSSSVDLEVLNGTLYAAIGYKSQVYEWSGSAWGMIAELSADDDNRVDLQAFGGNLYAGLGNGGEVFEIATIPEPSLMMSAVAGLLLIIRRKR